MSTLFAHSPAPTWRTIATLYVAAVLIGAAVVLHAEGAIVLAFGSGALQ
jgi:hypothetical protein